jgi:hypothetical protein
MSREVQFIRDSDGLTLGLSSTRWQLERGKSYPVELAAGATTRQAEVLATGSAVTAPLSDKRLLAKLSTANRLEVRGAGSIIRVPLDRSMAGLERLEACFTKNSTSTEKNPFVEPPRNP